MSTGQRYTIGSLERGLDVLDALAGRSDRTLADLTLELGIPKPSLFRQLRVLEARGYVERSPDTKRYALGPRLIRLGYAARSELRLPQVAEETMRRLRDEHGETVHLGVLSEGEVVHVATVASMHPVKMAAEVGDRTWAHVSALGKALLAWNPAAVDQAVRLQGLPRLTPRTLDSRAALDAELERVREQGYAIDDEESVRGLRCVAVPVRDAAGAVVCALSVSAPADRLPLESAHALADPLGDAAATIAARIGGPAPAGSRR